MLQKICHPSVPDSSDNEDKKEEWVDKVKNVVESDDKKSKRSYQGVILLHILSKQ